MKAFLRDLTIASGIAGVLLAICGVLYMGEALRTAAKEKQGVLPPYIQSEIEHPAEPEFCRRLADIIVSDCRTKFSDPSAIKACALEEFEDNIAYGQERIKLLKQWLDSVNGRVHNSVDRRAVGDAYAAGCECAQAYRNKATVLKTQPPEAWAKNR